MRLCVYSFLILGLTFPGPITSLCAQPIDSEDFLSNPEPPHNTLLEENLAPETKPLLPEQVGSEQKSTENNLPFSPAPQENKKRRSDIATEEDSRTNANEDLTMPHDQQEKPNIPVPPSFTLTLWEKLAQNIDRTHLDRVSNQQKSWAVLLLEQSDQLQQKIKNYLHEEAQEKEDNQENEKIETLTQEQLKRKWGEESAHVIYQDYLAQNEKHKSHFETFLNFLPNTTELILRSILFSSTPVFVLNGPYVSRKDYLFDTPWKKDTYFPHRARNQDIDALLSILNFSYDHHQGIPTMHQKLYEQSTRETKKALKNLGQQSRFVHYALQNFLQTEADLLNKNKRHFWSHIEHDIEFIKNFLTYLQGESSHPQEPSEKKSFKDCLQKELFSFHTLLIQLIKNTLVTHGFIEEESENLSQEGPSLTDIFYTHLNI